MLSRIYFFGKFFLAGSISGISISIPLLIPFFILGYYFFLTGILNNKKTLSSFFSGWLFGVGFFISSMNWIVNPFLVYEEHFYLAPIVFLIFPLLMGLFFTIPSILFTLLLSQYTKNENYFFMTCFVISLFLFISEFLRSNIFGGLPFNLAGHIWVFDHKLIKIASYIGVFGLSFMTFYWITVISFSLKKKKFLFTLFSIFSLPLFLLLVSRFETENKSSDQKVLLKVIQPNISQKEKWRKNYFEKHIDNLLELSGHNNEEKEIIVIWPEVALTVYLNEQKELIEYIKKKLGKKTTLITGGLRRSFTGEGFDIYNTLYVIQRDRVVYYDKRRLVPFGEFIPLRSFVSFWKLTPGKTDFSVGGKANYLTLDYKDKKINFEPSICYEAIFQTSNENKVMLIINITNDAWFGNLYGPTQHLNASIFRSVEKGIPLIRSANSGISVITDSNGKVLKKIGLNKRNFIQSEISLGTNSTFFIKNEKRILIIFLILVFSLSLICDKIIKKRKSLKKM